MGDGGASLGEEGVDSITTTSAKPPPLLPGDKQTRVRAPEARGKAFLV